MIIWLITLFYDNRRYRKEEEEEQWAIQKKLTAESKDGDDDKVLVLNETESRRTYILTHLRTGEKVMERLESELGKITIGGRPADQKQKTVSAPLTDLTFEANTFQSTTNTHKRL
ncbi:hypothetical protein V866_002539 [Kwoniella sp. B9012]|uniref:Uncharacterized protein n=1 Tax=Kwoniella europaea PYCC6329 TaxID=1423913 RepID=A0AAX4KF92_9TREE